MKRQIKGLVPRSLTRTLQTRFQTWHLSMVPTMACHAECLLSRDRVFLDQIFRSRNITSRWEAIRKQIQMFDIPDQTGGVNPGDRRAIYYLVSSLKPRSVLEVGTHIGASTVHIALALRHQPDSLSGQLPSFVSVDVVDVNDPVTQPWLRYGASHSPIEMIDEVGCADFVSFVHRPSTDYLAEGRHKYDFIFLDGDHAAQTVYQEIPAALRVLNSHGVILLHDYFPKLKPLWSDRNVIPGPFLATERLRGEGAGSEVLPIGELPWPTKLRSNVTSLALLLKR